MTSLHTLAGVAGAGSSRLFASRSEAHSEAKRPRSRRTWWQVCTSLALLASIAPLAARAADSAPAQQASFRTENQLVVKVPAGAKQVRIWFPVPQQTPWNEVKAFSVDSAYPVEYHRDSWGNRVGYIDVEQPNAATIDITEHFDQTLTERKTRLDPSKTRPLTDAERTALQRYLLPTSYVIVNDQIKGLAKQIVGDEQNPILAARKLYDWTLDHVTYWVEYPDRMKPSDFGSTDFCLQTKSGNCTDFHSLFSSLAMADGIPTRMVYGSLLKPTLDGVKVDASYHCWIEFYAPNYGWIPLDVSLANVYGKEFPLTDQNRTLVERTTATGYHGLDKSKIDYYFGNLDDRRFSWSTGRDLMMQPPQQDGPVNSLATLYVEVDGKRYTGWTRKLTYTQTSGKSE
ncbi:transglutaminase-like domain-containing protein [Paraburkholderia tropica]|uniref:Transglutaminase-like putative cysteine protease n=1 Tax=Paraburkholderia tropica TaxID=92647 RepID=A0ABX5MT25_9BURK|nr:transglutaminase domain-containing protein [Paraburkholderia tropica]MDE1138985.1 transglutaminase domain-containing protein [Paraburkholderia tropica]PXX18645.1 transglutaminase-like putative cysteine protease [Paraburkholderia tropica]PZW87177.1 transglutaminase-like putative cysteine protease [Paraburkholderia tropica]